MIIPVFIAIANRIIELLKMLDDELLHKWIEGTITADELKVFQLRPEYDSLVDLYKNSEHLSAPDFDQDGMLQTILKSKVKSPETANTARQFKLPNWSKFAIAASLLALVAMFFWPSAGEQTRFATSNGETTTERLPDGSVFTLNADSELSYSESNWKTKRELFLQGEAYFEVEKGATFTVVTDNGSVEVLGTHFNVWSRGESLEVSCQEGRVAVRKSDGTEAGELSANDALRLNGNKIEEKWRTSSAAKADWVAGIFKFRKVPLSRVLAELERQFDVQIVAKGIATSELLSCNFQTGDLEMALKTSLTPLQLNYTIGTNKTVTLSK